MEWKVDTHMSFPTVPTKRITRSFISFAALFVKVMAKMFQGFTDFSSSK